MNLSTSVALITGGASGLGFATASHLVSSGASVVILDLPTSEGGTAAASLGERANFVAGDVTDPGQVTAGLDAAEHLGPLRIAVNCAGVVGSHRVVGKPGKGPFPLEVFERVVSVNLVGTFNVIRLAAERISAQEPVEGERGVIVNTASAAAFEGQIGQAAYAASKAGIVGMTLPIARDLASRLIRVNTIAPGLFRTPLFTRRTEEQIAEMVQHVPHPRRMGEPAEFAALVAHIIENPMINGETIRLDAAVRFAPR